MDNKAYQFFYAMQKSRRAVIAITLEFECRQPLTVSDEFHQHPIFPVDMPMRGESGRTAYNITKSSR